MKRTAKKLALSKETLQILARPGLQQVAAGGMSDNPESTCGIFSGCGVECMLG